MKKRVKKVCLTITLLIGFIFLVKPAEAYYGEKYEPTDGRVYHGLGQYVTYVYTDQENWNYVTQYQQATGTVPLIYTAYYSINPKLDEWPFSLYDLNPNLNDLVRTNGNCQTNNHDCPYIILLGIGYYDMDPEDFQAGVDFANMEVNPDAIINGEWDEKIISLAQEIKQIDAPFLLRPGWEFGIGSNGAHEDPNLGPTNFIACWNHIQDIFNQEGVNNVAWVWNLVNPNQFNPFNYMDYYPGDDRVDWWGINYFTTAQMNNGDEFLQYALSHKKPVLIGESCPIHNGGTTNSANWNNWFVPYFNKIKNNEHIKAFVYISDPWDREGFWQEWADSRITANATIRQNYSQELNDPRYVHMAEYLVNPEVINGEGPTPTPTPPSTCSGPGDINCDQKIDSQDCLMVLSAWLSGGTAGYQYREDVNDDGRVNGLDFGYVLKDWGF